MLPYCWAHVAFHLSRLYPKKHRLGVGILLALLSGAVVFLPVWVLLRPRSVNYCNYDLFLMCTITAVLAIISAGFTLCFAFRDPLPATLRGVFQYFGFVCAALNIVTFAFVHQSPFCAETTPELYHFLYYTSILGLVATVLVLILAIFWVKEHRNPGTILDIRHQAGVCYDAYTVCPCVWHV